MGKGQKLLILALAFAALMAAAYGLYSYLGSQAEADRLTVQENTPQEPEQSQDSAAAEPEQNETVAAPDFTVYDAEGGEVHLSDYLGTPVVLNFWASWCGPCRSEMPEFNEACARLEGQVQFLMINMTDGQRETVETAQSYVEEQGFTFPVVYDTTGSAAMAYAAYSLPTTYFIGVEGDAVAMAKGAISGEILQQGIDMILPAEE